MCLFVDESRRAAVTSLAYSRQRQYLPTAQLHRRGLFAWERATLANPRFPARGRLLLGAAGGGRELRSLCERGYEVVAFEPTPALVEGARMVAAEFPGTIVVQASYEDLTRHVAGEPSSPFADKLDEPFDGVILGWGSLSHVLGDGERVDLLRALREVAPEAPMLVSFNERAGIGDAPVGRITRLVITTLRALGVRVPEPQARLAFSPHYGFRYLFRDGEIDLLAAAGGYAVAYRAANENPNALLVPVDP
jgi:hypothetical protein